MNNRLAENRKRLNDLLTQEVYEDGPSWNGAIISGRIRRLVNSVSPNGYEYKVELQSGSIHPCPPMVFWYLEGLNGKWEE